MSDDRRRQLRVGFGVLTLVLLLGVAGGPVARHARAGRMLVRFAEDASVPVEQSERTVAGLRARSYGSGDHPLLLVHGVHPDGMDEPRLRRFAAILADEGFRVVTPHLEALATFRLDPATSDRIAAAARALADEAGRETVGVVGISVGGGLALRAAAEEPRISAVLAIGAHHDARRLARWWTGGAIEGPGGEPAAGAPERYGAQVLAHGWAEEAFGEEAPAARRALEALFRGRPPELDGLSERGRARIAELRRGPGPPWLAALVEERADELADASPAGQLASGRARVFLLHGARDPVVASTEALFIADELPPQRLGGVVRTPLIGHAERHAASLGEQLEVVRLVAGALAAL